MVVTFTDDTCLLFPDSLLYATLPKAEDLSNLPLPGEKDGGSSEAINVIRTTDSWELPQRTSPQDRKPMAKHDELRIVEVDRYDGDQLLVNFSDGTFAVYTVDQLAALIPNRMKADPELRPYRASS